MNGKISKEEISEKQLTPKEIIGATNKSGVIEFLIKWTDNSEEPKLVKSEEAKEICPYLVIDFYEKRLVWRQDLSETIGEITEDDTTDDEINL